MRKWIERRVLLLLFLLIMIMGMTVSAENTQKVVDHADLLTAEEEETLQEQLSGIAENYQCDIAVVTVDSCAGKDIQTYTDDYYYENGYGYGEQIDGIMLLISMEERQFHLSTRGEAIQIFTDYGLEQIDLGITEYLSDADYDMAFWKFGSMAESFMQEYHETGEAYEYDYPYEYEEEQDLVSCLLIGAGIGLAAALLVVIILFAQLKSVRVERYAGEYVKKGSFHLSRSRDIYLYHTVTKRRKPKEDNDGGGGGSSTHSTSDGGTAGGRTGSF